VMLSFTFQTYEVILLTSYEFVMVLVLSFFYLGELVECYPSLVYDLF
jgi:hypothetical protein